MRSPLDPSALRQFGAGDAIKALQLLRFYCKTAADDLDALDRALAAARHDVAHVAHRMKGAAQMIGARHVDAAARELERLSRKAPDEDLSALAERLRGAVAGVVRYVDALEGSMPATCGRGDA